MKIVELNTEEVSQVQGGICRHQLMFFGLGVTAGWVLVNASSPIGGQFTVKVIELSRMVALPILAGVVALPIVGYLLND